MQNPEYLTNAEGHMVPISTIKQERLLEHDIVNDLHHAAHNLQHKISTFKAASFEELNEFVALLAQKYGMSKGGKKGNMTFTNFEGTKRIVVSVQDYIAFGPELEIAKDLVDECIRKWLDGGTNQEITQLVSHAFRVDNGRINVREVLRLKQINIIDDTWKQAMSAIDDAIRVERSKSYIRYQTRKNADSTWVTTPLDIARV